MNARFRVMVESLEGRYNPHWVIVTHVITDTLEKALAEASLLQVRQAHNRQVGRVWVDDTSL